LAKPLRSVLVIVRAKGRIIRVVRTGMLRRVFRVLLRPCVVMFMGMRVSMRMAVRQVPMLMFVCVSVRMFMSMMLLMS